MKWRHESNIAKMKKAAVQERFNRMGGDKARAAKEGKSMQGVVLELITRYVGA